MACISENLRDRTREFTLASVLSSYPDDEFEQTLKGVHESLAEQEGARALIALLASPDGIDDLRAAYIELFDRGKERASLYETEYGRMRGMSKGNDLADIAGFYQAFGLTNESDDVHEMHDHIAVELEFYAVLLVKELALVEIGDAQGLEIVQDARKKFLVDHLGGLARAIAQRSEVSVHPIYGELFAWCWKVVSRECASFGVEPTPLDFFSDEELKEEMKCGAVHLPIVQ